MCAESIKIGGIKMAFYLDHDYSVGKWFDYPEYEDLKLKLKFVSSGMVRTMKNEHWNSESGEKTEDYITALLCYAIEDWKGFYEGSDDNAKPAKVNRKNIVKLLDLDMQLVTWVIGTVLNRSNFHSEQEEALLEKN
jgi:hypothetical protein